MRNKYRIERDIVTIEIIYKDAVYETKLNSRHLEKLINVDVKWGIRLSVPNHQMYVMTQIRGKTTYLHRFITNAPKGKLVDHANHDTLNNLDENLNIVGQLENQQNLSKASRNNKTGVLGVSWDKFNNKYRASIVADGKQKNLGRYENIEDAIRVRREAEIAYFPYLSKINRAV